MKGERMSGKNIPIKGSADIRAEEETKLHHQETSGDRTDLANTYIKQIIESKTAEEKKQKEKEFDDFIMREIMTDFVKNAIVDIKGWMDERQDNMDKLKKAIKIMKNWDSDDARLFLISQGINVNGMSENDLVDTMNAEINNLIDTDKDLSEKITNKIKEARKASNDNDLGPELNNELTNLTQDHEQFGIVNYALIKADKDTGFKNKELVDLATDKWAGSMDDRLANASTDNLSDPFAEVAQSQSISFAASVDNNNSNTVESISDPFNAVASDLGIDTVENKNDLSSEVDQTVKLKTPGMN